MFLVCDVPPDLEHVIRTCPPPLKKYLAALADAKVIVMVEVDVVVHEPEPATAPLVVISEATAVAFNLLVVQLVMSVETVDKNVIVSDDDSVE